ncbi:MAG TPA: LuxR C-terminal-related transcriptional regulator [Chlamydiales bacterium]|nr:LuxR C-terminal-related transcriptional regulator [Chlamydiales bacterium]
MKSIFQNYCKRLDQGVDSARSLSRHFRETFGLTAFAYVRVYRDGRVGWVTSDADHDRLLIERGYLEEDPLIDTAEFLKKGHYLWFHDRQFPGCESFYHDRQKLFGLDHGLVVVNHRTNYLETGCFSGCLAKRPLYNLFLQEKELFREFTTYFGENLTPQHQSLLEEGLHIEDLKSQPRAQVIEIPQQEREQLAEALGYSKFLKLSKREKECLLLMGRHLTYEDIAQELALSQRTVEHYLKSVKTKLEIDTRPELYEAAQKMALLRL